VSKKVAFISLNLDSIGYATNSYPLKNDPAFTIAIPRIEKILDKYDIKMSVFVIGKDLKEDSNVEVLQKLIHNGHEIGNHTFSHFQNFSFLDKQTQSYEIEETHRLIYDKLNYDSKGFIAPGWNSNNFTIKKLADLNYFYDHSLAPTPLMFLAMIKMLFNNILGYLSGKNLSKTYKLKDLFKRKDYLRMFFGRENPYPVRDSYIKNKNIKLWVIPLPTKYKLSYWLTLEYVFPKFLADFIFNLVSKKSNQFYLLIHPADFLDNNDLKDIPQNPNLERMEVLVEEKIKIFENRLKQLIEDGFEVKTFISHYKNLI
jgi:peptidoglycan/xylan/chitin deacetylase (PgdA/CDA1 family)